MIVGGCWRWLVLVGDRWWLVVSVSFLKYICDFAENSNQVYEEPTAKTCKGNGKNPHIFMVEDGEQQCHTFVVVFFRLCTTNNMVSFTIALNKFYYLECFSVALCLQTSEPSFQEQFNATKTNLVNMNIEVSNNISYHELEHIHKEYTLHLKTIMH